jgi:hypothetical protein
MQRQVRGLVDPLHNEGAMRLQKPLAMPAHLARRNRTCRTIALRPFHHGRNRNTEPFGNRSAALTGSHRRNNTPSKIIGKSSGHQMLASNPASILNHNSDRTGIPSDSVKP